MKRGEIAAHVRMHFPMSALPPKADMCGATGDVRFGPKADMCSALAYVCFGPKADIVPSVDQFVLTIGNDEAHLCHLFAAKEPRALARSCRS